MEKLNNLKKKIVYRSLYRGSKEMDILMSTFVKFYIDKFNTDQLNELYKFLDIEDAEIYDFYLNNILTKSINENKISKIFKNFKI
jgi:antitoxin CptB